MVVGGFFQPPQLSEHHAEAAQIVGLGARRPISQSSST
jgi:hypothetical protein